MTALLRPPIDLDSKIEPPRAQKVVLHNVPWKNYKAIGDALRDQHVYLTYDRGVLEIMVMSSEHERYKSIFLLVIFTLARYFRKKIMSCGSFTHQRDDLERGLEPDQCFYLASYLKVKGKKRINLMRDPPPDLAVEVDIESSSLDRLAIYAALGVAEVWHFDGNILRVLLLKDGEYEPHEETSSFPGLVVADLLPFIEVGIEQDETAMVDALEKWLKRRFSGRKGKKP